MTHNDAILSHLQAGRTLTTAQAASLWNCYRLAARILELRLQGHAIETEMVHDLKTGKRYARYSL